MSLAEQLLNGSRRALARVITRLENQTPDSRQLLAELYPHTGNAHLTGITGAPGTGKSTLVNQMAKALRQAGETVAVIAVDPTSPFSGGAVLGDRIRMRDLAGDPGVFIRSMASRGSLGGLAHTTANVVHALDAAGFGHILIETVGSGQLEIDIAKTAHTTIVIEAPGLGDDVQAIKAGILEIADVLVVNKADRPGAQSTVNALRTMLGLAHPIPRTFRHHGQMETVTTPTGNDTDAPLWIPPICTTVATSGEGVDDLLAEIARHRAFLDSDGQFQARERARVAGELEVLLRARLYERFVGAISPGRLSDTIAAILARQTDIYSAVEELLK